MTDRKDMSDPSVRPPFWQHRYYYLALSAMSASRAGRGQDAGQDAGRIET